MRDVEMANDLASPRFCTLHGVYDHWQIHNLKQQES